jgi:hypothetical protein
MKNYRDVWIVLRIDGPALGYTDYISVKGVYGSQEEAQAAADRAAEVNPPYESQYHIFKKKQETSVTDEIEHPSVDRIQGISRSTLESARVPMQNLQWHSHLKELARSFTADTKRRTFSPLLGYFAEQIVAAALQGSVNSNQESVGDVVLADGRTVEVKAIVLDGGKKAPFVMIQPRGPEFVALVIFTPELDFASGFLLPASLMEQHARHSQNRDGKVGVRITPALLTAPGVRALQLPNALLNPPIG